MNRNYSIRVDADGVLADWDGLMKQYYPEFDRELAKTNKKMKSKAWAIVTEYQKTGYFWYDLPLLPDARVLFDYVTSNYSDVKILTACGQPQYKSGEQKLKWFAKHFGDIEVILVEHSKDKAQYATRTTVLIDDMEKSVNPFRLAGGHAILHTSAKNTITVLENL